MDKQIQEFQRLAVPGQRVVHFSDPGGYVIYIERPGSCCAFSVGSGGSGGVGTGPPFSSWSMNIALQAVGNGQPVPIRTWRGATESYAAAGHQGQTAMYFTINRPGAYNLGARNATPNSLSDVAVGRGIGHSVFIDVLLLLIAIFVLAPAALLIGIITAVRRRRARRALLARSVPQPAAPPASAGWQPGPAQPPGGQVSGGASQGQGGGTPGSAPSPEVPHPD
jgi:hypothetical protein